MVTGDLPQGRARGNPTQTNPVFVKSIQSIQFRFRQANPSKKIPDLNWNDLARMTNLDIFFPFQARPIQDLARYGGYICLLQNSLLNILVLLTELARKVKGNQANGHHKNIRYEAWLDIADNNWVQLQLHFYCSGFCRWLWVIVLPFGEAYEETVKTKTKVQFYKLLDSTCKPFSVVGCWMPSFLKMVITMDSELVIIKCWSLKL